MRAFLYYAYSTKPHRLGEHLNGAEHGRQVNRIELLEAMEVVAPYSLFISSKVQCCFTIGHTALPLHRSRDACTR
jgi:hypothetical protein